MAIPRNTLVIEYNAPLLGQALAQALGGALVAARIDRFADTECDVFLEKNFQDCAGHTVILVAQLGGNITAWPTNDFLLTLCFLVRRIRAAGAVTIHCILPYFPYARQNIVAHHGGISSARILTELLTSVGVDEIITIDLHNDEVFNQLNLPITNIVSNDFWLDVIKAFMKNTEQTSYVLVAPDNGASLRVQLLAQQLGIEACFITKQRIDINRATAISISGHLDGRYALILDDIIDTGRTAISAADLLLSKGAVGVSAFFTHAVLSTASLAVMQLSPFGQIIVSDTVHRTTLSYERLGYTSIIPFLIGRIEKIISNKYYTTTGTQGTYEPGL